MLASWIFLFLTISPFSAINYSEEKLTEHRTAINERINQLIENYNKAINAGDHVKVNQIREEKIKFIIGRLNDFTKLKTVVDYNSFLLQYGLSREMVNENFFMGFR
ncbi:unnamed protein product [Meloidogyne enterolobii]|uniref:Uncharacterized protein n=1 Tax=Meloidogyne enterolobii TaxID=390850 RepID=A0ACB0YHW8_MELEN